MTLTDEQVRTLLSACTRLRDRFLLALLAETGMFSGGPLGAGGSIPTFAQLRGW